MIGATVTSAPAKAADGEDLARALAAIAALAIIAKAIDDRNDRDDRDDRPTYRPPTYPPYVPPYHPPYQPPYHHPNPPNYGNKILPSSCRVAVVDPGQRREVYYLGDCLQRAGLYNIPRACASEVRMNGKRSLVYRDRCLFDRGYRTAYR
jgi:hypothetical protein